MKPVIRQSHRNIKPDDGLTDRDRALGLKPVPLEVDRLLARIEAGGRSAEFLADSFLSAYRPQTPFRHSLAELNRLDAEGFHLFHQVLHIRLMPGWSDDGLYCIEQQIANIKQRSAPVKNQNRPNTTKAALHKAGLLPNAKVISFHGNSSANTMSPIDRLHNGLLEVMRAATQIELQASGKTAEAQQSGPVKPAFPMLDHRFYLGGDELTETSARVVIRDMADTALAMLALVKSGFEQPEICIDNETFFYGLHAIRKELRDIETVAAAIEGQNTCAIRSAIDRVKDIIRLLSERFERDDQPRPAPDSIIEALSKVVDEISAVRAMTCCKSKACA